MTRDDASLLDIAVAARRAVAFVRGIADAHRIELEAPARGRTVTL